MNVLVFMIFITEVIFFTLYQYFLSIKINWIFLYLVYNINISERLDSEIMIDS